MGQQDLNKLFRNPPRGGNERGVSTENSMSPLPAREPYDALNYVDEGVKGPGQLKAQDSKGTSPLASHLTAGENSARSSVVESALIGRGEFRNTRRSPQPIATGSGYHATETEHEQESSSSGSGGNPQPEYDADTSQGTRSDGKPKTSMGTANGNRGPYKSEKTSRQGPTD